MRAASRLKNKLRLFAWAALAEEMEAGQRGEKLGDNSTEMKTSL
jgi:hypothetical protein